MSKLNGDRIMGDLPEVISAARKCSVTPVTNYTVAIYRLIEEISALPEGIVSVRKLTDEIDRLCETEAALYQAWENDCELPNVLAGVYRRVEAQSAELDMARSEDYPDQDKAELLSILEDLNKTRECLVHLLGYPKTNTSIIEYADGTTKIYTHNQ